PSRPSDLPAGGTCLTSGIDAHRSDQSGDWRCDQAPLMVHHRDLPEWSAPNQPVLGAVERASRYGNWLPRSSQDSQFPYLDAKRCGYSSPRMKASTRARPSSSGSCTGGDFMRYDDAEISGPPMPRSLAIFAARIASMMIPAELGESQTSSLYSRLSGTSPNARPSRRT